jgi:hypothetical protein
MEKHLVTQTTRYHFILHDDKNKFRPVGFEAAWFSVHFPRCGTPCCNNPPHQANDNFTPAISSEFTKRTEKEIKQAFIAPTRVTRYNLFKVK